MLAHFVMPRFIFGTNKCYFIHSIECSRKNRDINKSTATTPYENNVTQEFLIKVFQPVLGLLIVGTMRKPVI